MHADCNLQRCITSAHTWGSALKGHDISKVKIVIQEGEKMSKNLVSVRIDDGVNEILHDIMKTNQLNRSEAIRYLAEYYKNNNGNNNPYYRKLLAKFSMDMENALNLVADEGNIKYAHAVMEDFLCQIL